MQKKIDKNHPYICQASYYFYPQLFDQVSPEAKDLISRLLKVIIFIPTPA
jgi:hypothetical protein